MTREDAIYAAVYAAEFDRQRVAGATADDAHVKARAEARVAVEGAGTPPPDWRALCTELYLDVRECVRRGKSASDLPYGTAFNNAHFAIHPERKP